MLDKAEEQAIAERFGVAREQVRRDHLISHLLAALSRHAADDVLFFGGTALSRTVVTDGRLSEDIDLITRGSRRTTAAHLDTMLVHSLRREFPGLAWQPALSAVREARPAAIVTPDGLSVRIQLLTSTGYPPWPTERRDIAQRYSDAAPALLEVPTAAAFAAWKTAAWADRAAARDLYDLWLLAERDALTAQAAALYQRFGPTNRPPAPSLFTDAPDEQTWRHELSGQTRLHVSADAALARVRAAWQSALGG